MEFRDAPPASFNADADADADLDPTTFFASITANAAGDTDAYAAGDAYAYAAGDAAGDVVGDAAARPARPARPARVELDDLGDFTGLPSFVPEHPGAASFKRDVLTGLNDLDTDADVADEIKTRAKLLQPPLHRDTIPITSEDVHHTLLLQRAHETISDNVIVKFVQLVEGRLNVQTLIHGAKASGALSGAELMPGTTMPSAVIGSAAEQRVSLLEPQLRSPQILGRVEMPTYIYMHCIEAISLLKRARGSPFAAQSPDEVWSALTADEELMSDLAQLTVHCTELSVARRGETVTFDKHTQRTQYAIFKKVESIIKSVCGGPPGSRGQASFRSSAFSPVRHSGNTYHSIF